MPKLPILAAALTLLVMPAGAGDLKGHGGPVRSLAVSADGATAVSGSFDTTAILWSLDTGTARQVLRFHEGAVNAVAVLPDGRAATAGEDGRIAIWTGGPDPADVLQGHRGPVVALSVSADGARLGSASWDGTARIWSLSEPRSVPRVLEGHAGNVNGIGFLPDGAAVTIGYDATLRIWRGDGTAALHTFPTPLNSLAVTASGGIAAGGADGRVRLVSPAGAVVAEAGVDPTPVIAIAAGPGRIAASGLDGSISLLRTGDLRLERTLVGPRGAVWSLAFRPDADELLAGGSDGVVRRWNAATGERLGGDTGRAALDPLVAYAGDPGAEVFRACVACHTLGPDEGVRAGPSLYRLMGRRIGSLPDYAYSAAFDRHDIIWTPGTVARMFEIGPQAFVPGTKMPEQKVVRAEDRAALVRFLERATAAR
jgi:cytochrome c